MKAGKWRRVLGLIALVVGAAAAGLAWYAHGGYARAEIMARFQLWPDAREQLTWYLFLHPRDDRAHLAFAEACIKDENLSREEGIEWAARHLAAVPDTSRYAAMARSQEGRLELFVAQRPYRAEQRFRHAMAVNPRAIDPYFMIWKLYDLTGRSHLAEAEFWRVYEASPLPERGSRLREWFMSQFYPATANPDLDRLMGVMDANQDAARTEAQRYVRFRDAEPDGPAGYAALGRWFEQEGDPKFGLTVLEKGLASAPQALDDPFFRATLVTVTIAVGEVQRADELVETWPEPRDGYEYWLSRAQVLQEARNDPAAAVEAYDRALAIWPGPADWRTLNRQAACLVRLRRDAEVAPLRERIQRVEQLTSDKNLRPLRVVLGSLDDPDKLKAVAEFYRQLGRPREAQGWDEYLEWLRARGTTPAADQPSAPAKP
ncbi:MAG: hypothetical protein U0935_12230 [Pirellulales bacterium]